MNNEILSEEVSLPCIPSLSVLSRTCISQGRQLHPKGPAAWWTVYRMPSKDAKEHASLALASLAKTMLKEHLQQRLLHYLPRLMVAICDTGKCKWGKNHISFILGANGYSWQVTNTLSSDVISYWKQTLSKFYLLAHSPAPHSTQNLWGNNVSLEYQNFWFIS